MSLLPWRFCSRPAVANVGGGRASTWGGSPGRFEVWRDRVHLRDRAVTVRRGVVGMNLLLVETVDTNTIGEVRGGTSGSGCASSGSSVKTIWIEAFNSRR